MVESPVVLELEPMLVSSSRGTHSTPPNGSPGRSRKARISSLSMKGARALKSASEVMFSGSTPALAQISRTRSDRVAIHANCSGSIFFWTASISARGAPSTAVS